MSSSPFDGALGAEHVCAGASADAVDEVVPRWVVRPGSPTEAAAVVRIAAQEDLAMIVRGRGQHLSLGDPPRRADVVVSTQRLDRIVTHEPADMTVRVQAGCSLNVLAEKLANSGQWLPLDPPCTADTTVGGLLATNLSGPLRASQGAARDLLIGIRTVGADGSLVSGGGRVVKNVAGYDLPKMHIGALGTLGVIVEATFKVRPRPSCEDAISISCASAEQAATVALELRDACEPFWLEIVSTTDDANPWSVVVAAGGGREEVDAAIETYRRVALAHCASADDATDAAELRRSIVDQGSYPPRPTLRASTLPTLVGKHLASLRACAEQDGATPSLHADVSTGVIRAALDGATDMRKMVEELRPTIESDGGVLVAERASAAEKRALGEMGGVWGDAGPGLRLMRALKQAFDPAERFAPGRFVGGI